MKVLRLALLTVVIGILSCKEEPKQSTTPQNRIEDPQQLPDLELSKIIDLPLVSKNSELNYQNIEFTYNGSKFDQTRQSYIEFDHPNFRIENGLSINMVISLSGSDGKKPQAFLSYTGGDNSKANKFSYYFAGQRITGIVGDYELAGKNYKNKEGTSPKYFSSPRLELNKFYCLSILTEKDKTMFYINGELYSEFEDLQLSDFMGEKVILGAFRKNSNAALTRFFSGTIRNIEIYNRSMTLDEIQEFYLINESEINAQNDIIDDERMKDND